MIRAAIFVLLLAGLASARPQKPPPACGVDAEALLATGVTRERLDRIRVVLAEGGDLRPGTNSSGEVLELLAARLRGPGASAEVRSSGTTGVGESRSLSIAFETREGCRTLASARVLPGSPAIDPEAEILLLPAHWSRSLEGCAVRRTNEAVRKADDLVGLVAARARCVLTSAAETPVPARSTFGPTPRYRGVRPASFSLEGGVAPPLPVFEVDGADAEALDAAILSGPVRLHVRHEVRVLDAAPVRRLEMRAAGPTERSIVVAVGLDEAMSRGESTAGAAVAAVLEAARVLSASLVAEEVAPLGAEVRFIVGPARPTTGWAAVVRWPAEAKERILLVVTPAAIDPRRSTVVLSASEQAPIARAGDGLRAHAGKRGFFAEVRTGRLAATPPAAPGAEGSGAIILEVGLERPGGGEAGVKIPRAPAVRGDEALARAILVLVARLGAGGR